MKLLTDAARKGDLIRVQMLYPDASTEDRAVALVEAAREGHLDVTQWFISTHEHAAYCVEALQRAAEEGYEGVVKLLIPVSDAMAMRGAALACAAREGHLRIVEDLLAAGPTQEALASGLCFAAEERKDAVLRVLLPLCEQETIDYAFRSLLLRNKMKADALAPFVSLSFLEERKHLLPQGAVAAQARFLEQELAMALDASPEQPTKTSRL